MKIIYIKTLRVLMLFLLMIVAAITQSTSAKAEGVGETKFPPVTDELLNQPAAENWLNYRGNLAGWGYSALTQISHRNVNSLSLAWALPMSAGTNEATPLVYNGVLYIGHPDNLIQAVDARNGDVLWEYQRQLPDYPQASITRSLAIYDNKVFVATHDAYLVALNAHTGQELWETKLGDYRHMSHPTGPIIARGKVITGSACGMNTPGGCFITAHDATTGKEIWRRYVIPKRGEPGDETWGGIPLEQRTHIGAWGPGSYDAELNLLYFGTSNPSPSPEVSRGTAGQAVLYANSTLALNADSGEIVWYFQHLPRPNWDLDHVFERILVDSPVNADKAVTWSQNPSIQQGKRRKLMTGIPGKTGLVWTLDRASGEFLWAKETIQQNVIQSIDPLTGAVTVNEAAIPDSIDDTYGLVCPSAYGGRNWMTGAYSPKKNALYMPLQNTCMRPEITEVNPSSRDSYGISLDPELAPEATALGRLEAISVETGKTLWTFEQRAAMYSVVATAGNLVFAGDANRRFRAFNASTGNVLWQTVLNAPVTGHPISYSVDGRQYIAVAVGGGDRVSPQLNRLAGLTPPTGSNMLYVFALPSEVAIADPVPVSDWHLSKDLPANTQTQPPLQNPTFTRAQATRGQSIYTAHCASCHKADLRGGSGPSLMGKSFLRRWSDQNGLALFDRIRNTMPLGAPRSLSRQAVADLLAYWYAQQGFEAGEQELTANEMELRQIRIVPDALLDTAPVIQDTFKTEH